MRRTGGASVLDHRSPQREGQVRHAEVVDDAAIGPESVQAWSRCFETTDHGDVVGDGQQQRSTVGVAVAQDRFDLQTRPRRIRRVDDTAVVDDMFEHRQGSDPHQRVRGRLVGSMGE